MASKQDTGAMELSPLHRKILLDLAGQDTGERAPEDYRYAIYARKSTDDKKHQLKSLDDQIRECKAVAESAGLRVVTIIQESVSAKSSGMRPKFRQMLDDITKKKYEGIIAWGPDRLARNMREGGEIIDMLDEAIIKDLRFVSIAFSNSGDGKTMLGMNFVLAKQWIDSHSSSVKRGVGNRTEEGVIMGMVKHGYYKDGRKHMRPDGENWALIRGVFDRRLEGQSLKEIAEWLKSEGYPRETKHQKRRSLILDEGFVSAILQESVYAGILIHGDKVVDLRKIYDFTPVVTEDEFTIVTKKHGLNKALKAAKAIKRKSIRANLLRGVVICDGCEEPLAPTMTTKPKKDTQYFYFRCDTPGCPFQRINLRAKTVIEAAVDHLHKNPISNHRGYEGFVREMRRLAEVRKDDINANIRGLEQRKHGALRRLENIKNRVLTEDSDPTVQKAFGVDIKQLQKEVRALEKEIGLSRERKEGLIANIPTFEKFVELTQNMAGILQKRLKMRDLDFVMQKLFSNFHVSGKKVTKVQMNSPFAELSQKEKNHLDDGSSLVTPGGIEPPFSG